MDILEALEDNDSISNRSGMDAACLAGAGYCVAILDGELYDPYGEGCTGMGACWEG